MMKSRASSRRAARLRPPWRRLDEVDRGRPPSRLDASSLLCASTGECAPMCESATSVTASSAASRCVMTYTHRTRTRLLHRRKSSHGRVHLPAAALLLCEGVVAVFPWRMCRCMGVPSDLLDAATRGTGSFTSRLSEVLFLVRYMPSVSLASCVLA